MLDFILLVSVSLILRRITNIIRIIMGAFIGSISILALFIIISSFELFLFKIFISILMILISFGYKNIKYTFNNLVYLYLLSIILGGALYLINDEFSYKNTGLVFFHNGFSINFIIILILSPIVVFLYVKRVREEKERLSRYYKCSITFLNNKIVTLTGFLDTGNNLYDPYKKRPIILLSKKYIRDDNYILVPYYTTNGEGLLKCIKPDIIFIEGIGYKGNILIGFSDSPKLIDGVDVILHKDIMKGW